MSLFELFQSGGWAMWPLLIMSIITVSITVEKIFSLFWYDLRVEDVSSSLLVLLKKERRKNVKEYLSSFPRKKIAAHIFLTGIKISRLGEQQMEKVMEAETEYQIKKVESGLDSLAEMISLAPVVGFLGTVSGMIHAFHAISKAVDVNTQLIAGGIFEALITTAFGLIIAVAAALVYYFFKRRIENFISEVEWTGTQIISMMAHRKRFRKSTTAVRNKDGFKLSERESTFHEGLYADKKS